VTQATAESPGTVTKGLQATAGDASNNSYTSNNRVAGHSRRRAASNNKGRKQQQLHKQQQGRQKQEGRQQEKGCKQQQAEVTGRKVLHTVMKVKNSICLSLSRCKLFCNNFLQLLQ
jgi:hypothetical protein